MIPARAPFDPGDPFDAMAESIRRQVCDIALGMLNVGVYRDLTPGRQIECLIAGLLTGTIGALFAQIDPIHSDEGRAELMRAIEAYLPQARQQAEEIIDNG